METMKVRDAINSRRSIRQFTDEGIPATDLYQLIEAATQAPSAKNRQPWFFFIINDADTKAKFISHMNAGIDALYEKYSKQAISRPDILSAKTSAQVMERAAAIILVEHVSRYETIYDDGVDWKLHALDIEVADLLSIGAAIQNILLAAKEMHLGTLWVCDIFYAYPELVRFLKTDSPILSAICIGHTNEEPSKRPRLPVQAVSTILIDKEN